MGNTLVSSEQRLTNEITEQMMYLSQNVGELKIPIYITTNTTTERNKEIYRQAKETYKNIKTTLTLVQNSIHKASIEELKLARSKHLPELATHLRRFPKSYTMRTLDAVIRSTNQCTYLAKIISDLIPVKLKLQKKRKLESLEKENKIIRLENEELRKRLNVVPSAPPLDHDKSMDSLHEISRIPPLVKNEIQY